MRRESEELVKEERWEETKDDGWKEKKWTDTIGEALTEKVGNIQKRGGNGESVPKGTWKQERKGTLERQAREKKKIGEGLWPHCSSF